MKVLSTDVPLRLEHIIAETPYWLRATRVPGLAVGLLENGKTRHIFCFGTRDAAGPFPITESTVFQAASLSKQALLYAALKTIEAGKLDIDLPLAEYLQAPFDADDPELALITARHVLSHTTGWLNWPPFGAKMTRTWPLGERWGYSGHGFLYLQAALEAIWDEPADHYTRRLVFAPLAMTASSFLWRDDYADAAASGCDNDGSASPCWHPDTVNGAAGLHTTIRDYALLLEAYLDLELCGRHPQVYQPLIDIDERLGWSLGWGTAKLRFQGSSYASWPGSDVLWQWGHNDGFKTFAALAPARGLGVVVMANGARGQRINAKWVDAWLETELPAFFFRNVEL